ncbi:MAG TPA: hypothetical protein VFB37_03205, partial [Steroidobacteraceae bacterium]|nr:hypothetical protein [Steroidobacteraceae bacterium]
MSLVIENAKICATSQSGSEQPRFADRRYLVVPAVDQQDRAADRVRVDKHRSCAVIERRASLA